VDESRTHYQISLTKGQAAGAFVVLVVLLLVAYFLGLLTGLSGREEKAAARVVAAAAPTPTPEAAFPKPVLGVAPRGPRPAPPSPVPSPEPSPAATPAIQLFSDRTASEPTQAPAAPAKSAAGKTAAARPTARPTEAGTGFWVQVDSLSSKEQAESRRRGLKAAGFDSTIVPGTGPKGPVYRIRTGPYATREEADRAATRLAEKAKVKQPWVVPPGQ
jgi:cell division septation protein DedD